MRWIPTAAMIAALGTLTATPSLAQSGDGTETAVFAGGCFWCVEADFESVDGVEEVISGFAGGDVANPTYSQVTGGGTGHLEAAQVIYDPDQVSYRQLADLFLRSIDPFDTGGQFCDRGPSYAPAFFPRNDDQRQASQAAIDAAEQELGREIAVPIKGDDTFYPVGDYHQDYYKSDDRLAISSVGVAVPKKVAYKRYRQGCRRDERVREIWGAEAPFLPSDMSS